MAKQRAKGIMIILIIAAIVVGGGGGWYLYEQWNYVSTDNASVQGSDLKGSIIPLSSPGDGTLKTWQAKTGWTVNQGAVLGQVAELDDTLDLRAPITGTIVENDGVQGQVVVPGQEIGYIVNLSELQVVANIDETLINEIQAGRQVDISVTAYSNVNFTGTVSRIGSASAVVANGLANTNLSSIFDKVVQRVPVYITINGMQGKHLVPGLSASVKIHKH
ncbi:Secretion protein HlyD family protein [Candidatus Desulfosporosinus infrequens]|uniref:Secretion protein HlyD family protein n=1 Tax=Candidatus Desulfosporosinus infrequens TaxID=2043169 RepID=A0A2U3KC35_9FIRM|nr:Secretion protein HlyD family protein [Candidatus Desulfosporosinus infrequens]